MISSSYYVHIYILGSAELQTEKAARWPRPATRTRNNSLFSVTRGHYIITGPYAAVAPYGT